MYARSHKTADIARKQHNVDFVLTNPSPTSLTVQSTMTQNPGPPPLPTFDPDNVQVYPASCHCGTVSHTVSLSPPLPEWKVVSCNCSICQRNGYLLVYPSREQLHIISGEEAMKSYSFGPKRNLHMFCGKCGSSVFFDPRMKEFGEGEGLDLLGINVSRQLLKWLF